MTSAKSRHQTEQRFLWMVMWAGAGNLINPAEVRGRFGDADTDRLLVNLASLGVVEPVYRLGEGEWTTDLPRFAGIPPEQIEVAFRRTLLSPARETPKP